MSTRLGKKKLLLDRKCPKGKRAILLYDYVKRNDSPNLEGAGVVLSCTPTSVILRKTVDHLEKVLLDNILMVRPGDASSDDPEVVKRYVWKLIGIGAGQVMNLYSKTLLPFLEEAFTLAEENGLLDAAKTASSYLAIITVARVFDKEKYEYYKAKNDYYELLFLDYQLIRVSLGEIEKDISKNIPLSKILIRLKQLWAQCLQAERHHHHPRMTVLCKMLQLRIAFIEGDQDRTAELATQAIDWVKKGPRYLKGEEKGFILFLSQAYLISNNYEVGYPYITQLLKKEGLLVSTQGKLFETGCLLCLRSGHYPEAIETFLAFEKWINRYDHYESHSLIFFKAYLWLLYHKKQFVLPRAKTVPWLNHKSIKAMVRYDFKQL